MKNRSLIFFSLISLTVFSCKDNTKQDAPEVVTVDNSTVKVYEIPPVAVEFNDPKVEAIFEQYIQVEAALVNTDAHEALVSNHHEIGHHEQAENAHKGNVVPSPSPKPNEVWGIIVIRDLLSRTF